MNKTIPDAWLQMSPFLKSHMIQIEHSEVIPKHAFCLTGQEESPSLSWKRKKGFAGGHLTISWLLGKSDIPHKTNGVWLNGIECSGILRFGIQSEHQERV